METTTVCGGGIHIWSNGPHIRYCLNCNEVWDLPPMSDDLAPGPDDFYIDHPEWPLNNLAGILDESTGCLDAAIELIEESIVHEPERQRDGDPHPRWPAGYVQLVSRLKMAQQLVESTWPQKVQQDYEEEQERLQILEDQADAASW